MLCSSSLIQTILSVLEFHQFSCITQVADYTAGGESHPAPKISFFLLVIITHYFRLCKYIRVIQGKAIKK